MRLRVPFLLGAVAVSCGGGTPPNVIPTVPATSAPAPTATAHAEAPSDMSALPAPDGLDMTAHFTRPRAVVDEAMGLAAAVPLVAQLVGMLDADALVQMAAGAPIGPLIDMDAPIDFAFAGWMGDGAPMLAASAVLLDPASARATLDRYYKAEVTAPGVTRLTARDDPPDGSTPVPCMIAPAIGGGARLVCGMNEVSVRRLGPYLVRTMGRVTSTEDMRFEVFAAALRGRDRDGDVVSPDKSQVSAWTEDAVDKLTRDATSIVIEASADPKTLDVKTTAHFASATSPVTRALLGAAPSTASPPPIFDRLPADASFAWYGRGASADALAPMRTWLLDEMRTLLDDDGYSQEVIDQGLSPLSRLLLTGGAWTMAAGYRVDQALAAVDAYENGNKKTDATRAVARAALQGWTVVGIDEPAQKWIDGARDEAKLEGVRPTRKRKHPDDPPPTEGHLAVAPVPPSLGLPSGTLHLTVHVTQSATWLAARAKKGITTPPGERVLPHTVHLFIVPDGARTWFAVAEDPALAATEVRKSLAGAPDTGTLGSRRDLDPLRAMPATIAGFVSTAWSAMMDAGESEDGLRRTRDVLTGLTHLPDHGTRPVPIALTTTPGPTGSDPAGEARLRAVIPLDVATSVAASSPPIF